jgi:hypothetical protein
LARSTINRGVVQLLSGGNDIGARVRRPGGGRKSAVAHQPGLPSALEALIEDAIRGDPATPLRWVSRSLRHLVKALAGQGFTASQRVVANLLRELQYSCPEQPQDPRGQAAPQFRRVHRREVQHDVLKSLEVGARSGAGPSCPRGTITCGSARPSRCDITMADI